MESQRFAIFDTALGHCAIVWNSRGISGVRFPEGDADKTRAAIRRRFPDAVEAEPEAHARNAIDNIVALIAGENIDLSQIPLDHSGLPEFSRQVYEIVRTIPPGQTMTYGDIAKKLGDKLLARDVGQAMGKNPTPIIMPCHRVLAANGKPGGFSAPGGVATKLKLLSIEQRHSRSRGALFEGDPAFILQAKPRG